MHGQLSDSARAVELLINAQRIVVFAGAGISTSAGMPEFRSADTGLFRGSGTFAFDSSIYLSEERAIKYHNLICGLHDQIRRTEPTPFHNMLAKIAEQGRLLRLYTMNIDGLETRAAALSASVPLQRESDGLWPLTVRLHGDIHHAYCQRCFCVVQFDPTLFRGSLGPGCVACEQAQESRIKRGLRRQNVGRMRPRVVLYNDQHDVDQDAVSEIFDSDVAKTPDLLVVVGTSFGNSGLKGFVRRMSRAIQAHDPPGNVVWINARKSAPKQAIRWDMSVVAECDDIARLTALVPTSTSTADASTVNSRTNRRLQVVSPVRTETYGGTETMHGASGQGKGVSCSGDDTLAVIEDIGDGEDVAGAFDRGSSHRAQLMAERKARRARYERDVITTTKADIHSAVAEFFGI